MLQMLSEKFVAATIRQRLESVPRVRRSHAQKKGEDWSDKPPDGDGPALGTVHRQRGRCRLRVKLVVELPKSLAEIGPVSDSRPYPVSCSLRVSLRPASAWEVW